MGGQAPPAGARTAITDINLSKYAVLVARHSIITGTRQREPKEAQPLFQRILGAAWDRLPKPIKQLHSMTSISMYSGRCTMTEGRNPIARAVMALVGFPKVSTDLPIRVKLSAENSAER